MARVVLAMSGGVDSSVAAWLLKQEGHEVIGLFMRHGQSGATALGTGRKTTVASPDGGGNDRGANPSNDLAAHAPPSGRTTKARCCSAADAADARRVAERLALSFYVLDFERDFDRLVAYFVAEYLAGRTPNPCIRCNTWLKFDRLFDFADAVGAAFVATGHYAVLDRAGEPPALRRAADRAKDQSYVLFGIPRERLGRLRFPIGLWTKSQVRRLAREIGLPVAEKRESQEICFVPDGDHAALVRRHRVGTPDGSAAPSGGEIVALDGTVLGRHDGIERFTVGQRKGLGVALGRRMYVVRIEPQSRRVVLGDWADLARRELSAAEANWLRDPPSGPFPCAVQIRYRSRAVAARVECLPGGRFRVEFEEPCHGVAPGQAAVCYAGDRVLGGGWIES